MAVRNQVTFLLNGRRHDVSRSVPPTRTLLDYLREDLGLMGTKEGCNEGDCGACTVVVARPQRSQSSANPMTINACITLVPMVDGLSITTVEGVSGPDGELHPCQQAMVDCHGSQCGFCTPGFVMSLHADYLGSEPGQIDDVLAGNLCRCTGYGPIVAAAERMRELPEPAWQSARAAEERAALEEMRLDRELVLDTAKGRFIAPRSLKRLVELAEEHPHAHFLGGATDIGLWITKQLRALPMLISTEHVPKLQALREESGALIIGAAVTYSAALATLKRHYPDLGELVRRIGSVQVRNLGTTGGNIANGSPIGDMPPALMALGATLVLNGPGGERRLPLEDYFLAYGKQDRRPGEFVQEVRVPLRASPDRLRCYKISKRFDQDISAVCGCFNVHVEGGSVRDVRIAFGGMAAIPKRAKAIEAMLAGKPWTLVTVEAAMPAFEQDFRPISDMRASAEYRLTIARSLLLRCFHETTSDAPTRLAGHDVLTLLDAVP